MRGLNRLHRLNKLDRLYRLDWLNILIGSNILIRLNLLNWLKRMQFLKTLGSASIVKFWSCFYALDVSTGIFGFIYACPNISSHCHIDSISSGNKHSMHKAQTTIIHAYLHWHKLILKTLIKISTPKPWIRKTWVQTKIKIKGVSSPTWTLKTH